MILLVPGKGRVGGDYGLGLGGNSDRRASEVMRDGELEDRDYLGMASALAEYGQRWHRLVRPNSALVPDGYAVAMGSTSPRSIRFDERVNARMSAYVARHPGSSGSSVANQFVDEALRMDEHPGVLFRDGRTGRRAVLVGGPDVREVIRAIRSARSLEPTLDASGIVALVARNTGVPARLIDTAIRYWSSYPDEIDAWIADVEAVEAETLSAWERQQDLLST